MRLIPLVVQLVAGALVAAPAAVAQAWQPATDSSAVAPAIGSLREDGLRLMQTLGRADSRGFLLRSNSTGMTSMGGRVPSLDLVPFTLGTTFNSAIPFSRNDGVLWAGRGLNAALSGGVRIGWGPFAVQFAPAITYSQNRAFDLVAADSVGDGRFIAPWRTGRHSADLPIRFGDEALTRFHWGESAAAMGAGVFEAGLTTESQWWGPGMRNAIVLSNNAGGFPHLFLRTRSPVRTAVGDFEGRWIIGSLLESGFFDSRARWDRSLSGFALTYRPAAEPDLTIGAARVVYAAAGNSVRAFGHAFDVFTMGRENVPEPGDSLSRARREQILSLFGRWIFPDAGLEVHAEWARTELPPSLREVLTRPYHSQGYTLGLQWARPVADDGALVRLQSEFTYLEKSSTALRRYTPYFYVSPRVEQGYTHRGQALGAAIGPGASSQYIGADYVDDEWQAGLFAERIRWDNDAYYTRPNYVFGHDVSFLGGIRGGIRTSFGLLEAEFSSGTRLNFLFQNTATGHNSAADSAVDVRNHTLRLRFTPSLRRRSPHPPPRGVIPLLPAVVSPSTSVSDMEPSAPTSSPDPISQAPVCGSLVCSGDSGPAHAVDDIADIAPE